MNRDECTPARVIDRWGPPFPLSRSAPAATRTADLGRCPGVDAGGGVHGWGVEGEVEGDHRQKKTGQKEAPGLGRSV